MAQVAECLLSKLKVLSTAKRLKKKKKKGIYIYTYTHKNKITTGNSMTKEKRTPNSTT
jgi:hypothetical protein